MLAIEPALSPREQLSGQAIQWPDSRRGLIEPHAAQRCTMRAKGKGPISAVYCVCPQDLHLSDFSSCAPSSHHVVVCKHNVFMAKASWYELVSGQLEGLWVTT